MTTPIHTIVWTSLGETTLAQAEFNRSMHAACYGPFNVRNEVRCDVMRGGDQLMQRASALCASGRQACGYSWGSL